MYLYRYIFFREYLLLHWRRYARGRILLSDFRDVAFQRSPHHLPAHGLHISLESNSRNRLSADTVKGQPFPGAQYSATAGWMHLCYDDAGVTAVYEKPLSCSGVTWGGVLHVRMYLALMLQEFVALQLRAIRRGVAGGKTAGGGGDDKSSATKCLESIGVDQGIHNMLLHNGTFDRYVRMARVLLLRGFHVLHFHVLHFHVLHFHVLYFLLGSLPARFGRKRKTFFFHARLLFSCS